MRIQRIGIFGSGDDISYWNIVNHMKRAFEKKGVICHVGSPFLQDQALRDFIEHFKPDAVFEINRSRNQAKYIPANVLHVCWVQDHRNHVDSDLLHVGFGGSNLYYFMMEPLNLGFSPNMMQGALQSILTHGVDTQAFRHFEADREYDMAFAGYMPIPWDKLDRINISTPEGGLVSVRDLAQALKESDIRQYKNNFADVYMFLDDTTAKRLNRPGESGLYFQIPKVWQKYLDTEALRVVDRGQMLDGALKVSESLAIYGNPHTWMAWPKYLPYYRGVLATAEQMARAYGKARLHLHNGAHSLHMRVLEGMSCQATMAINKTPYDASPGHIYSQFEPGVHYVEYDLAKPEEALREALADEERLSRMGEEAMKLVHAKHTWDNRIDQILGDLTRC